MNLFFFGFDLKFTKTQIFKKTQKLKKRNQNEII